MDALRFGIRDEAIQEGLSFAALQTVSASLGGATYSSTRSDDAGGIDALCNFRGCWLGEHEIFSQVEIHFQLKSTRRALSTRRNGNEEFWSLPIGVEQLTRYSEHRATPLILVLFVLPSDSRNWVKASEKGVFIFGNLYWTPLEGFPLDTSKSSNTVYVPKSSLLTPETLTEKIITPLIEGKRLVYGQ